MPATRTFLLVPLLTGLDDPAWALSTSRAACFVEARDAREARSVADGHFLVPVWPDGAVGALTSPWRQESLVLVEERMEGEGPGSRKADHK
jgi:hypothetical protein